MATRKGTGGKKRKSATRTHKQAESKRKPLSPREKVRKSQQKVLTAMPAIVNNICGAAKKGSHTAAKFVFDFARITELQSPLEGGSGQESLAGLLLEKLEGNDPPPPKEAEEPGTIE